MTVAELIAALQQLSETDKGRQVAYFSRWAPSERDCRIQDLAEVVVQAVLCDLPYETIDGEHETVRVVCLNPSFRALDHIVERQQRPTQAAGPHKAKARSKTRPVK